MAVTPAVVYMLYRFTDDTPIIGSMVVNDEKGTISPCALATLRCITSSTLARALPAPFITTWKLRPNSSKSLIYPCPMNEDSVL